MAVTLLKTAGAISLVIFSLLMILTAFASRNASYAMIDGDIRQSLTFNAERAGYAKAALAVLVFSLSLFLLGYAAGQGQKKCPRCAESVKREAMICRFCQHAFPSELELKRGSEAG